MTYQDFKMIWNSALEYTDDQRDLYHSERGWQTWMDEYGDDTQGIVDALDTIYAMAHGGIKAMRETTHLSQQAFGDAYGIPRRTIQAWENNVSSAPLYVTIMIGFAVFSQK